MEDFELREDRPLSAERIELVALDLDGTLLRSDLSIGLESAQAIVDATRRGVKVVLASGRGPRSLRCVYQPLGLRTLQVAHNGALIFHAPEGTLHYHQPLAGEIARAAIELARQVSPQVQIALDVMDKHYVENATSEGSFAEPTVQGLARNVGCFDAILARPVTKVMVMGNADILGRIQGLLAQRLQGQVGFAYSHMRLLQLVHPQVDKAPALEMVCRHYGIQRQRVMVIGDAPNDIGMMRWAGMAVAMDNCWESVRRVAHVVVASNEQDGVAVAIRKYVLI